MNRDQFLTAALQNPANEIIAEELLRLALPDAWLVSGCLVQTVWNVLTGRATWPGLHTLATVYSGHQFGVWAGQLGDGRALLLGEWQPQAGGVAGGVAGGGVAGFCCSGVCFCPAGGVCA